MSYLNNLTATDIKDGQFPLNDVIANSFFYPACDNDGGVVRDCNTLNRELGVHNFIYCDYAFGEEQLNASMHTFQGYSVLATKSLTQKELVPKGWIQKQPPGLNFEEYNLFRNSYRTPFAKWIVYQRNAEKGDDFGPNRFSLLYIGGEGVATYQALYWSNNACPKAIAIIQPGHAFGLNWTNFTEPNGYLHWVVANHPSQQMPEQIYFGGIGSYQSYDHLNWKGYTKFRGIKRYYNPSRAKSGYVAIYKK